MLRYKTMNCTRGTSPERVVHEARTTRTDIDRGPKTLSTKHGFVWIVRIPSALYTKLIPIRPGVPLDCQVPTLLGNATGLPGNEIALPGNAIGLPDTTTIGG